MSDISPASANSPAPSAASPAGAASRQSAEQLNLAKAFLDMQGRELALRSEELGLRKSQQSQTHEFNLSALNAQAVDREKERVHKRSVMRQYLLFSGVVIVLLVGFCVVAVCRDKEQLVLEALKIIASFGGGMGAGAFLGYRRGRKERRATDGIEDVEQ